jgi:hypothetical protein
MFDNDQDYDNDNELPRDFCTDPLEIMARHYLSNMTR